MCATVRFALSDRRRLLFQGIQSGIVIIASADMKSRSHDTAHPYRQNSNFYYLTATQEHPLIICFLVSEGQCRQSFLFHYTIAQKDKVWENPKEDLAVLKECLEVDELFPLDSFEEKWSLITKYSNRLYYPFGDTCPSQKQIMAYAHYWETQSSSCSINNLSPLLYSQRLVKDKEELSVLQKACSITVGAHQKAFLVTKPNIFEYQVSAHISHHFLSNKSCEAYPNIVAGGGNALILHYSNNTDILKAGDLLLIDAGCEHAMYASDVTRTIPISGVFSAPQKEIYDLVLEAQEKALSIVKHGRPWSVVHMTTVRVLAQGLKDLGFFDDSVESIIEKHAYKLFYPHSAGHQLGLDVHDPYKNDQLVLQENMVITVEPGLYIAPHPSVPEKFHNIGIRIEDTIQVTEIGHNNFTQELIKHSNDIEYFIKHQSIS